MEFRLALYNGKATLATVQPKPVFPVPTPKQTFIDDLKARRFPGSKIGKANFCLSWNHWQKMRLMHRKQGGMKNDRTSPSAMAESSGRATILVVEDEFLIRVVISDELREAGHVVIEADCSAEAMAILESGIDVDLIFSDVRMPGAIDGLGLLQKRGNLIHDCR